MIRAELYRKTNNGDLPSSCHAKIYYLIDQKLKHGSTYYEQFIHVARIA